MLPAVDRGTPEQQRRLLALCNGSGDVTLAASVSGILFANHIIPAAQRSAAERFAKARAAIFGQPLSAKRDDAPSVTDERLAVLERRYNALCGRLTIDQQLAVISVALEQRPVWLRRAQQALARGRRDGENRGETAKRCS